MTYIALRVAIREAIVKVMTLGVIETIGAKEVSSLKVPRKARRAKGQGVRSDLSEKSH